MLFRLVGVSWFLLSLFLRKSRDKLFETATERSGDGGAMDANFDLVVPFLTADITD